MARSNDDTLDDELGVPKEATLDVSTTRISLETNGSVIPVSHKTCNRANGRSIVVGRQAATADLRIQHGSISRKHAVLYVVDNQLFLKDLGGKHGTSINNRAVEKLVEVKLVDGCTIQFGSVRESLFRVKVETIESGASSDTGQKQQNVVTDSQSLIEKAGEGLSGRAKRQAEIAAMMESFDQAPTYRKVEVEKDEPVDMREQEELDSLRHRANEYALPISRKLSLASESDRRNAISCLAIDPSGARFVAGSTDTHLRFFDFGGMLRDRTDSFKDIIPDDGYLLVDCAYSNSGDRILCGTSSVQPRILDRDGEEIVKFVRGDMYVTDQAKTVGHTAAVTSVDWHPLERDVVLTGSADGSARLWNLKGKTQFQMLVCEKVFQAKSERGQRTAVTCVCFHPGGREFAIGTACGSLQIWNRTRLSGRPERAVFRVHGDNKPVSYVTYSYDGLKLASRSSEDGVVHVWDGKRMSRSSKPIISCSGLESVHEGSDCCFSPDSNVLCAGSSFVEENDSTRTEVGSLNFYDLKENTAKGFVRAPIVSLPWDGRSAPIVTKWHLKLNQILVGCSDGRTIIFYDMERSSKGALLAASKTARRADALSDLLRAKAPQGSAAFAGDIITPFSSSLPRGKKRKEREPEETRIPELPATGKHKTGGQAGGSVSFAQFVADQRLVKGKAIAGKDPRDALFQYNDEKSPVDGGLANARRLADKTAEEEEEEMKPAKR